MARVCVAAWFSLALFVLAPISVVAADAPFRTVIGPVVPAIPGLSVEGAPGGCDLFLVNQTGQDVLLLDDGSPAKVQRFQSAPKSGPRPPATLVHLAGNWKCATLPSVTEDQAWNSVPVSVMTWTLRGQVGTQAFRATAQTVYDPILDPTSNLLGYVRLGAVVAAVGGLVLGVPYLLMRRRQILSD